MAYKKLTPNFSVKSVKETVLFYQDILGFELSIVVPNNKKVIENSIDSSKEYDYAMMKKDEVFVMFLEEKSYQQDIPVTKISNCNSVLFYLDVENINEIYSDLQKKEVEIIKDLHSTWYGMKEFYIKDCNGYILGFGERDL
ncbi:VOC family protein [Halarcobacter anaerophilus]|uniref:VOC family protein n=1 Tax=Halarcobacter anaerophilus TaxID=877500 RepID=UPI0005C83C87|nr:VOC family protein [Halarcobacter anaerophilus]